MDGYRQFAQGGWEMATFLPEPPPTAVEGGGVNSPQSMVIYSRRVSKGHT